ncbi:hypothetical protein [Cupriavidus sp. DL-D2]|uniref:hypothetical protein n=1 Tax=Cupriavidus sp. DL-D2 TaxID=3144974 RepID=UPI0032150BC0
MALIDARDLPAPRLELRWVKTGKTWQSRECAYCLVLPLDEFDVRREDENCNKTRGELTVEICRTRVQGGREQGPIWDDKYIDTPYRDGVHAIWDAKHLGNLPIYAVCGDKAKLHEPRKPD